MPTPPGGPARLLQLKSFLGHDRGHLFRYGGDASILLRSPERGEQRLQLAADLSQSDISLKSLSLVYLTGRGGIRLTGSQGF